MPPSTTRRQLLVAALLVLILPVLGLAIKYPLRLKSRAFSIPVTPPTPPEVTPAPATAVFTASATFDDVNQDGGSIIGSYPPTYRQLWLGTGNNRGKSYTGLRFPGIVLPRGAKIVSARLKVHSTKSQWISLKFQFRAEASSNSPIFSQKSKPSDRPTGSSKVNHNSNSKWPANSWQTLNDISPLIQEVVNRPDWQPGNALTLILKGTGTRYGRKFVTSWDGNPSLSPRLEITFQLP